MDIQLYIPEIKVTLFKQVVRDPSNFNSSLMGTTSATSTTDLVTVAAQSAAASAGLDVDLFGQKPVASPAGFVANQEIDLTPFLGDDGGVRLAKSVRDPAGGFHLTLAEQPLLHNGVYDSIYAFIEPQDLIEIRLRHNLPGSTSGNSPTPPVYMRGLVTSVDRDQEMGSDGKPHRTVLVSGQDMGKLWQIINLIYTAGYIIGSELLSGFKLFELYGAGYKNVLTAQDFVQQFVTKILNPFFDSLTPSNSQNPRAFKFDIGAVPGVVSLQGVQNQQGTLYKLLSYFCDVGVFNELYTESREDGEYVVFRPSPYKDVNGNVIQPGAVAATPIDVQDADIIALRTGRTDANVANYYWTRSERFELASDVYRQLSAIQGAGATEAASVNFTRYPNSAEQYYGLRAMQNDTQMGGDDVTTMSTGLLKADQDLRDVSVVNWINNRRAVTAAQNRDVVIFETGTARIRCDERIRAGCYVTFHQGQFVSTFYVPRVELDYVPYEGMFMTLTLERGDGYIKRMNGAQGMQQSSWLQEMVRSS
ncbi:hypothetical protein SAMN05414139_01492 [Burkholderia sp. D7]|nr:hypothetical protein SAMN05414139_01492 [Burkholderia sp. D7]